MYQMLAYSIRREIDQVLLIYPKNGAKPSEVDIFTVADTFANDKLITIKAADIDICGKEDEIIEQLQKLLSIL